MRISYRKPGKYSVLSPDPLLTKEKFDELTRKLNALKHTTQPRAAEEVRRLGEMGDFSENAEYQIAKGRLRGINNRILMLEHQLSHADIIKSEKQIDTVSIGHIVTLACGDTIQIYQILGSSETNPQKGIISHTSPIGIALIGRKVGDTVTVSLPKKKIIYTILKILTIHT